MEQLGHPPTLEFLLFLHKNFVWKYMRNTKLMVDKATLSLLGKNPFFSGNWAISKLNI